MCKENPSSMCYDYSKSIEYIENNILVNLSETYARPCLNCNSVNYSPHYLELIDDLESRRKTFF